ncbi:MAG: lytic murein transglycosylase, partial [Proteobacteria bacterium]|nr:lytic murein transglycosylase [Pseudomonadota bacterium]
MRRLSILSALSTVLAFAAPATHAAAPPRPGIAGPQILTSDVERFYQVYEAHGGHPDAATLERDYFAPGSSGLHEFMGLRRVSGETVAKAIAEHPEAYENARKCLAVLPNVTRRLTADFAGLARAYPEAKFPPVTLVVGRTRPVGITNPSGVTIGLEALCSATFMNPDPEERFVHIIMHEYGHIQQEGPLSTVDVGQPNATVLTMSLMEGAAEFFAERFSGDIGNHEHRALTRGHEAEIEQAFVRDEDKTDLSAWLYNSKGTAQEPGDLGYWVGYRIVKAYY